MKNIILFIVLTCSLHYSNISKAQKYYNASQVSLSGDYVFHKYEAKGAGADIYITPQEDEVIIITKEESTDYKNINYNLTFFNISNGNVNSNKFTVKGKPQLIGYSPTKDTLFVMTDAGLNFIKCVENISYFLNVRADGYGLIKINKDELAVIKSLDEAVKISLYDLSVHPINDIAERNQLISLFNQQFKQRDTICSIGYTWNGNDFLICNIDGSECSQIKLPSGFGMNSVSYAPSHDFVVYITNTMYNGFPSKVSCHIAYFNKDESLKPVSNYKYIINLRRTGYDIPFQKDFNTAISNGFAVYGNLYGAEINPLNGVVTGPDKSKILAIVKLINSNDSFCTFRVYNYKQGEYRKPLESICYISDVTPRISNEHDNYIDDSKRVARDFFKTEKYKEIKTTLTTIPEEKIDKNESEFSKIIRESFQEPKNNNEDIEANNESSDILNNYLEIKNINGVVTDKINFKIDFTACASNEEFEFFKQKFLEKTINKYPYLKNRSTKTDTTKELSIVINSYTFSNVSVQIGNTTINGVKCTIGGRINGLSYIWEGGDVFNKENKQSAIKSAMTKLEGSVSLVLLKRFPISTNILSFLDFNSKKVKTVSINNADNYGLIPFFELNIYESENSPTVIAVIQVTSNDSEKAICKVLSGGKELIKYKNSLESLYLKTKY